MSRPYNHLELNSPGNREPLEWARVNATVDAWEEDLSRLNAALSTARAEATALKAERDALLVMSDEAAIKSARDSEREMAKLLAEARAEASALKAEVALYRNTRESVEAERYAALATSRQYWDELVAREASRGVLVEALRKIHEAYEFAAQTGRFFDNYRPIYVRLRDAAAVYEAHSHPSEALEKYTAELRAKVLEEALAIVFLRCQPDHGDLFAAIDDEIRALKKEPRP